MAREGFYFDAFRCWREKDVVFLERTYGTEYGTIIDIDAGDVLQVVEMLIRQMNGWKRTPDAQVHSTEEAE